MVSVETGVCRPDEFEAALGNLNHEFVHSRGRMVEIQDRFPGVMDLPGNFLVRRVDGAIASLLAIKRFMWITPLQCYEGAMIGMVWTAPAFRGQGHTAANLEHARVTLAAEHRDFAVLWTTQPAIYSGSGWIGADCGLYGVVPGTGATGMSTGPDALSGHRIESIRTRLAPSRLARDATRGLPVPLPAARLALHVESDAYAILGFNNDQTFVLDLLGTPASLALLWEGISATGRMIHVNAQANGAVAQWMAQSATATLQGKPMAMWLPLSRRSHNLDFSSVYIPFLDRI